MYIHTHTHRESLQNTITVLTYGTEFYVNYRILDLGMAMKIILDDTFFIDEVNTIKACYLPWITTLLKGRVSNAFSDPEFIALFSYTVSFKMRCLYHILLKITH